MLWRVSCVFFAILLVLGCVSCTKTEAPPPSHRLEIKEEPIVYSAAFVEGFVSEGTSLLAELLLLQNGVSLGEQERAALATHLEQDFLPMALGASLSVAECEGLLALARECLGEAEDSAFALRRFYMDAVGLVGTARLGKLFYSGLTLYFNEQIAVCEERYRTYGYAWYLEDAERYRALLARLDSEISEKELAAALSVLALTDLADAKTGVGAWPAGILLSVWKWQAAHFEATTLSAQKWELMGELMADLRPQKRDTALKAELAVLQQEGRVSRLLAAMPALLTLYCDVVEHMDKEALGSLTKGDAKAATAELCRALLASKEALLVLTEQITAFSVSESEDEKKAIAALGLTADFEDFLAKVSPLSGEELCAALAACAESGDGEALRLAQIGFLRGVMPYFAYAIYHEGG